jgi:dihydropteroate synthase type 2
MGIFGILNVTDDSFSDGGKFLVADTAIAQAARLAEGGADVIDIGAASSNPRAAAVPPEVEIARLAAVIPALKAKGLAISIDSFSTAVQRWALDQGVAYLNDIHGFADPALYPALAASDAKLVVMHMVQAQGIATAADIPVSEIFDRVTAFFAARLAALAAAGIARTRIILDPGMGFFLGRDPQNSFEILRRLPELKQRFGLPLLVSVSRKSFLKTLGSDAEEGGDRSAAVELFAATQGASYIRTHAPAPLREGLAVLENLAPQTPED